MTELGFDLSGFLFIAQYAPLSNYLRRWARAYFQPIPRGTASVDVGSSRRWLRMFPVWKRRTGCAVAVKNLG